MAIGLVVIRGDSCLSDHGFESQHWILDGHFFTLTCCKNCIVCLKRVQLNEKETVDDPFKVHFATWSPPSMFECQKE